MNIDDRNLDLRTKAAGKLASYQEHNRNYFNKKHKEPIQRGRSGFITSIIPAI